jgi:hypothetical protein
MNPFTPSKIPDSPEPIIDAAGLTGVDAAFVDAWWRRQRKPRWYRIITAPVWFVHWGLKGF